MSTPQQVEIRQLAFAEYRAGNNEEQARKNIIEKLGLDSTSQSTISDCYQRFKSSEYSLFERHNVISVIQTFSNGNEKDILNSILMTSDNSEMRTSMITRDARFFIFTDIGCYSGNKIVFYDLFCDEKKEVPIVSNCGHIDYLHQHKLIGDNHLLIATYDELFLLKIDYKSWKVNIISKTDVSLSRFFIDQLNDNNFSTYDRFGFITGSLIGDEIVLNPRREFNLDNFILGKLVGNNLIGFRDLNRKNEAGVDLFEFCKIDLSSLTEEKCEVPLCLANNRPMPKWDLKGRYYCAGNFLYICFNQFTDRINGNPIFLFDSNSLVWTDIGITVYGFVREMFVDKDHFLTLQTGIASQFETTTFYRFPLKSPDTLRNLAWLTIRHSAMFFGGTMPDYGLKLIKNELVYPY